MNQKIVFIFAAVAVSFGILMSTLLQEDIPQQQAETLYTPPDMGKHFPNYELGYSEATYGSTDMRYLKNDVAYTVKGTVVAISDIQHWDGIDPNDNAFKNIDLETIKIEIDVEVDAIGKTKTDLAAGDIITITLTGFKSDNQIWFTGDEQYEVGETIIVHLGEDSNDVIGEDIKFSIAGGHTKYTVQNDMAYNHDNEQGKTIKEILEQSK